MTFSLRVLNFVIMKFCIYMSMAASVAPVLGIEIRRVFSKYNEEQKSQGSFGSQILARHWWGVFVLLALCIGALTIVRRRKRNRYLT